MILYTVVPTEDIWGQGVLDMSSADGVARVRREEIQWRGRRLEVEARPDGSVIISRLISSDPTDFLDAGFQPGTVLSAAAMMRTPCP